MGIENLEFVTLLDVDTGVAILLGIDTNPLSPSRMMLSTTSLKKQIPSSRSPRRRWRLDGSLITLSP
jgi:hypothetical protein